MNMCVCDMHGVVRQPSGVISLLSLWLLGINVRLSGLHGLSQVAAVWATFLCTCISRTGG